MIIHHKVGEGILMQDAEIRAHLREGHGWTEFDFTLFGEDESQQAIYLPGAHDQDHIHLHAISHSHD